MLDYSSNFKMNVKDKSNNTNLEKYKMSSSLCKFKKIQNTSRIICKHSILMLMLFHKYNSLGHTLKDANLSVNKLTFFFKPSKSKYFTLLRAPYRYKIARNQLVFKRFFVRCSIILKLHNINTGLPLVNSYKNL
jgi:hypothetical protein